MYITKLFKRIARGVESLFDLSSRDAKRVTASIIAAVMVFFWLIAWAALPWSAVVNAIVATLGIMAILIPDVIASLVKRTRISRAKSDKKTLPEAPTREPPSPTTPNAPAVFDYAGAVGTEPIDTPEKLGRVLASQNNQFLVALAALLNGRSAVRHRNYDLSLAPQLEELPKWIRDKVGQDEQVHGVIRKAWPHAIPSLLALAGLVPIAWVIVTNLTGKSLLIGLGIWAIIAAASVIWFMKHIRWALLLTDERFVRLTGVIQLQVRAIERSKITDFSTKRTLRGRVFGFWSLKIETAGQVQAFDVEGLLAGRSKVCTYYEQHLGRGG